MDHEPDRGVPGKLFGPIGCREIDTGHRPSSLKPGDEELLSRRVIQLYPGKRREFGAHAGPQRSGVVPRLEFGGVSGTIAISIA
jgi:hypothetical protein